MENKVILNSTELTGIMNRDEMNKLSLVIEEKKWKEYRKRYDEAANLKILDFPIQIDFELNSSCNLKCPMCPISAESPKGKGKSTWFDFELYKKIIDYSYLQGTRAIKLNYVNEPLIRKDIIQFIKYAKKVGILDIYLSTNGMLLNEKMSDELIDSGLTRIQISIDAVSEDTYQKVRPGGKLKTVISNLNNFIKLKKQKNKLIPLTRVNFVKTSLNENELDQFISYWQNEVDMIGVQEFVKPTKVKNSNIKSKKSFKKQNFKCSFPFKQLVITNEKKILPCCTFWGEELPLSTLNDPKDLKIAWNNEKMKNLRKTHTNGNYQDITQCKNCVEGGLS